MGERRQVTYLLCRKCKERPEAITAAEDKILAEAAADLRPPAAN
jgi:hypothetical protein